MSRAGRMAEIRGLLAAPALDPDARSTLRYELARLDAQEPVSAPAKPVSASSVIVDAPAREPAQVDRGERGWRTVGAIPASRVHMADRKRAHEAGIRAIRRGGSYTEAFAAALGMGGSTPPPIPEGVTGPSGPRPGDPLYGAWAQRDRWSSERRHVWEPSLDPFDWGSVSGA